ncbi:tetratricopeptide repeat protein, partial [bacterium]|nr:tetratricopeptide repeat protein [bacterium]
RGRWRAAVLGAVHVIIAAHVVHWKMTGRTVTPVEPSEAMQTLGQGLVNAGFVLFALLIVSTLIFGRFFCGWACHVVALQDLCTWFLRKIGVRPRPFRSRLLVFVPLLAALWMFVVPTVVRLVLGTQHPQWRAALLTDDLWDRFPGPAIAVLTLGVCGFLIVFLLGNKGFCTYGCPYGGVFGLADTVAPGKIRVSDACDGCGHCTATCTSNVRVHEEVKLFRMVVDPGCMKCMDCVDVCPMDALSYGWGAPSLAKGAPRAKVPPRRYDFTMREEVAMAAAFLASIVILRALYDAVPFLLALGLASISAYTLLTAWRMGSAPSLHWSRWQLRRGGRTTRAGRVFLAAATLWTVFLAHSAIVQWYALNGSRRLQAASTAAPEDASRRPALEAGRSMLMRAAGLGLFPSAPLEARIAMTNQELGDDAAAEEHYRRAVGIDDDLASAHLALAHYAAARGDTTAAIERLERVVEREPDLGNAAGDLADLLLKRGRGADAVAMTSRLLERRPGDPALRLTHALVLANTGDVEGGLRATREVTADEPADADAAYQLGRMLAAEQRLDEAQRALQRAATLAPQSREIHWWGARVAAARSDWAAARVHLEAVMRDAPFDASIVGNWAGAVREAGGLEEEIAAAEREADRSPERRFALVYLYRAAGREEDAAALAEEIRRGVMPR